MDRLSTHFYYNPSKIIDKTLSFSEEISNLPNRIATVRSIMSSPVSGSNRLRKKSIFFLQNFNFCKSFPPRIQKYSKIFTKISQILKYSKRRAKIFYFSSFREHLKIQIETRPFSAWFQCEWLWYLKKLQISDERFFVHFLHFFLWNFGKFFEKKLRGIKLQISKVFENLLIKMQ